MRTGGQIWCHSSYSFAPNHEQDHLKGINVYIALLFSPVPFTGCLRAYRFHFTSLHFTSLHFTSLHFTSLHFTSLHFTSLHFHIIWSEMSWARNAFQRVGQCTRSKAFERSKLTNQTGIPCAVALSRNKLAVSRCSSSRYFERNPCCSSGW